MREKTEEGFKKIFKKEALSCTFTRGRVNILGEHTDYNHGCVLPIQIPRELHIACSPRFDYACNSSSNNRVRLYSSNNSGDHIIERNLDDKKQNHWSDYVVGSLREVRNMIGKSIPSFDMYINSDVPVGRGVSSSAALEVAVIKTLGSFFQASWDNLEIAKMAQRAENNFVKTPCGFMDQMVISVGDCNMALFIDFFDDDNPEYRELSLLNEYSFIVFSSGVTHRLNSDDAGYKTRKKQCEEAARILQVKHLSMLDGSCISQIKDDVLRRRVRHVVTENSRVRRAISALATDDVHVFAECMNQSHMSQRDDYNVSIPEIDAMVETALKSSAVGARLTGGGFGGSIITLCEKSKSNVLCKTMLDKHNDASCICIIN